MLHFVMIVDNGINAAGREKSDPGYSIIHDGGVMK